VFSLRLIAWYDSILYHIDNYLEQLSTIVGTSLLTCGPILHWFEMDNHGNRLIKEESDINTPAIGAAFVTKKYCKKDVETEISLDIGELISVIEMPPPNESFYWKGKKGFEVGYFPAECVKLIDDEISRKSDLLSLRPLEKCVSPTPVGHQQRHKNGGGVDLMNSSFSDSDDNSHDQADDPQSLASQKRTKISALFRNFVTGFRMRRRDQLRRSGILKERVFGCDLCEHLENSGHEYPLVLTACCSYIEQYGLNTNGLYRISGVVSTINRLRAIFDEDRIPIELLDTNNDFDDKNDVEPLDLHAVGSLLKLYFRELPNPLLTYALFNSFISTMRNETIDENERIQNIRKLVRRLPPPHWRTLRYLIKHLARVSEFHAQTGMTSKNIAIVWAPNLLRTKTLDLGKEALQIVATQAVLTEFLIINCDKIFDREEMLHPSKSLYSSFVDTKEYDQKSPPLSSKCLKYIEVGPEIVPGKFHTIISCRPSQLKRSKFNLQNFKFHNLFTTRTSPSNSVRYRSPPHLSLQHRRTVSNGFDVEKFIKNRPSSGDMKKSIDMTTNESLLNPCPSMKHTASFQSKILCFGNNKQVKRSHSFDSYFKKMKTGDFTHLHHHITTNGRRHDDDNNNTINNNHGGHDTTDSEHPRRITDETIFEDDEKSASNDCYDDDLFRKKSEFIKTSTGVRPESTPNGETIALLSSSDDDDKENYVDHNRSGSSQSYRSSSHSYSSSRVRSPVLDPNILSSLPPTSIFDLYPPITTTFAEPSKNEQLSPSFNDNDFDKNSQTSKQFSSLTETTNHTMNFEIEMDPKTYRMSYPSALTDHHVAVAVAETDINREKIEHYKNERRRILQQRYQPLLDGNNKSNVDDNLDNNHCNQDHTVQLRKSFHNLENDNLHCLHSTKATNTLPVIKMTPLRTVNKRQRIIIDDHNELNPFLKNDL
ncbi:CDC42 GTPase-activating protein-like protein, partial [Euroglyphus maynei]